MDIQQQDGTSCYNQPKKLQCQCVNVCVRHPLETLQGKPYGASCYTTPPITANEDCCGIDEGGGSDAMMEIDMDSVVQSDGYYHDIELKTNCFVSNAICEELFQQIIRNYPEQYINLFVDTSKCRLTRIDLSDSETKYPLQDFDLISKLYSHPLREVNLGGCHALSASLGSLKLCASTLQVFIL